MGWQPIETAPKDGTIFDAWVRAIPVPGTEHLHNSNPTLLAEWERDKAGRRVPDARWANGALVDEDGEPIEGESCIRRERVAVYTVTHWTPLPDPPAV